MSVPVKTEPHFAEVAENEVLVESAMSGEIQHDAYLELSPYFARKALATRVLAALLLIPASPLIVLLAVLARCTSPGPGLFRQTRVGKGGHDFMMYKIRTMHQGAEDASGPVWCQPSDSRITCFGRLLRFLHLDELPQLINIVRGEMDLIGPRPERPEFVTQLVEEIPRYAERLAVLPGVTGLAQINLPPDESIHSVRRKLVLDLEYLAIASPGVDLRIFLCTALRMMGIRHGRAVRLLRLDYIVADDCAKCDRDFQSSAAQSVKQEYAFSLERTMDDVLITEEPCNLNGVLSHSECLKAQSDAQAVEEVSTHLSVSSSEVARAHPR